MQDEVGEVLKFFRIEYGSGDVRVEEAHYVVVCEGGLEDGGDGGGVGYGGWVEGEGHGGGWSGGVKCLGFGKGVRSDGLQGH